MQQHPRLDYARRLPSGAAVLDIGCWNYGFWRLCKDAGIEGFSHHGIDRESPSEPPPPKYKFARVDLNREGVPFPNDFFDGIYASHVLEHLANPIALTDECFRVLKAGGILYLECPSTRSLWIPSMPFAHEEARSLSFYDDPTHVGRPHTRQSLHRLLRMYGAEVLRIQHITSSSVRWRFPWLVFKALFLRDAAMLEDVVWKAAGFAISALGRKSGHTERRYVLPT